MLAPKLTAEEVLDTQSPKKGVIKCRLLHMQDRSFIQPDILLGDNLKKVFYVPKFFDPNHIAFFENADDDFNRFQIITENNVTFQILFFQRDKIRKCSDGSFLYRCSYKIIDGEEPPKAMGMWRRRGENYHLQLHHHTNKSGCRGILDSQELWGSRRNIQGNLWLKNIAYGYLTCLKKIRSEQDLLAIAMSGSGITGLIPTNAPYHPAYAQMVQIPQQQAADRSHTLTFWVDCELLAPNHIWLHRPMDRPAYYEVVLPKVFRIGVLPDATIPFAKGSLWVPPEHQKIFSYVIVGDGDDHDGLQAPFHEEETLSVAKIEDICADSDIIATWKKLANSDQFSGKTVEYVEAE